MRSPMGRLFIVSTPIGNLEDITIRAIKTLFSVDIIACEDTRRTGLLLGELKKRYQSIVLHSAKLSAAKLIRFDDRTEDQMTPKLIEEIKKGQDVALVSDAGTPLISDPGYILVSEAMKRKIKVVSIPGSSAVLASLTSSGLPVDKFTFLGYPPGKKSHRVKLFRQLVPMSRLIDTTYVFYCAPHKLLATLAELHETLGDIEISVCRELTKTYEECWVGTMGEALEHFAKVKGEMVILLRLTS